MDKFAGAISAVMAILALIMFGLGEVDSAMFTVLYAIWLQRIPSKQCNQ